MDYLDRRRYLALVAAGAVGVAGCISTGDDRESRETTDTETSPGEAAPTVGSTDRTSANQARSAPESEDRGAEAAGPSPAALVGERVDLGRVSVVVSEVGLVDDLVVGPDEELLEAGSGASFAVVDVAVQYTGRAGVLDVDEAIAVDLVDANGEGYTPVPGVEPTVRAVTAARLAPGEVVRGDLVYAVDDGEAVFVELRVPGGERVVVDPTVRRPANARTKLVQHPTPVVEFSQAVERAGVEVRPESLEQGNDLGGFHRVDEGYEAVVVGVSVENRSGRERTLAPGQTQLKDGAGRLAERVPTVVGALGALGGVEMADGEDHDGETVYRVEAGRSALYWVFDFGEWGEEQRVSWQVR